MSSSIIEKYCFHWNNQTMHPPTLLQHNSPLTAHKAAQPPCHLIAGLFFNEIYRSPSDSKIYICSTHNEVFYLILRYLRCSINFQHSNVDYGGRIVNGSWNGILSLIDQKKADFLPHIFSNTNRREEILEFEYLIPQKEMLTIFSYPKARISESPWNIFSSFSVRIWLLIGVFFLIYGAINWLDTAKAVTYKLGCGFAILANYTDMFAIFLGQGTVPLSSDSRAIHRNPLIIWVFATFLLRQLFASDITALLLSRGQFKFDTFAQLYQMAKDFKILIEQQSSSYYIFKEKFPSFMPQTVLISYDDVGSISTLQTVLHENAILVCSREYAELVRHHYSTVNFHISREGFVSSIGNYAIRKSLDHTRKHRLARLFRYIYYFGLTNKVDRTIATGNFRKALATGTPLDQLESISSTAKLLRPPNNSDSSSSSGSSHDESKYTILAYIYIYFIGLALALVCFVVEIFIYICLIRPNKRTAA